MNKDTKILIGASGTGKTTELIKRSAESGIYILVANRKRAEMLVKQAEDMKLYIPFPVTLEEWLRSSTRFHGSSIRRDGLLIDDIDDVIKELIRPIDIKAVTLRTPSAIVNLDHGTDDTVKVVRCEDCEHYISTDQKYPYCSMMSNKSEGEYYHPFEDHFCSYGERRENDTRTSKVSP